MSKTNKIQINNSKTSDDGFVILTALMVVFLIVSLVASVTLITISDLKNNAKQRHAVEARFAGETFADSIFASIATLGNSNDFINGILGISAWQISGTSIIATNETDFIASPWYRIADDGTLEICDNSNPVHLQGSCFKAMVEEKNGEVILTIVVRTKCNASGENCTYRQFEQRYKLREFLSNVSISGTENSGLGTTYDVAFLPGDNSRIDSNYGVHSNDSSGFLYCGQVNLNRFSNPNQVVRKTDDGAGADFCDDAFSFSPLQRDPQFLPGQVRTSGNAVNNGSVFQSLAGSVGSTYNRSANTTIDIQGDRISFNGSPSTVPFPTNGVIFVNGEVIIEDSVYNRGLTIYATGDIEIARNITAGNNNPTTLLGIASESNIELRCNSSGDCDPVTVEAVLNAKSDQPGRGKIWNTRWKDSPVSSPGAAPTFTLLGSMISYHRPVFGAYKSDSNGELTDGWQKVLNFDQRLIYNQPPFFFRTTQASVARSSIDEGPCTYSFCS
jgi:hypothetical protein